MNFDDLTITATQSTFGESAKGNPIPSYIPADTKIAFDVDGIFTAGYRGVEVYPGDTVTAAAPIFAVRLADFPAGRSPRQNDRVQVRGVVYTINEVQPDSHGRAHLILNRA